jgi:hypothetical protein
MLVLLNMLKVSSLHNNDRIYSPTNFLSVERGLPSVGSFVYKLKVSPSAGSYPANLSNLKQANNDGCNIFSRNLLN